jgi:DNA topoisomerase VI subunit B
VLLGSFPITLSVNPWVDQLGRPFFSSFPTGSLAREPTIEAVVEAAVETVVKAVPSMLTSRFTCLNNQKRNQIFQQVPKQFTTSLSAVYQRFNSSLPAVFHQVTDQAYSRPPTSQLIRFQLVNRPNSQLTSSPASFQAVFQGVSTTSC